MTRRVNVSGGFVLLLLAAAVCIAGVQETQARRFRLRPRRSGQATQPATPPPTAQPAPQTTPEPVPQPATAQPAPQPATAQPAPPPATPRVAPAPQTTTTDAAQRPHPAVVRVRAPENEAVSYGSGILVGRDEKYGVVLTNWHVVRDATGQISVRFPDGFRSAATVLETDKDWDLAALLIWRPNVEPVEIASDVPGYGDVLTIAGYGSGTYRQTSGRLLQYCSPGENHPFEILEVSVAARSGDSGGPILNQQGQMAGVLFGSAEGRTDGSHCRPVRRFLKRALTLIPRLAKRIVGTE